MPQLCTSNATMCSLQLFVYWQPLFVSFFRESKTDGAGLYAMGEKQFANRMAEFNHKSNKIRGSAGRVFRYLRNFKMRKLVRSQPVLPQSKASPISDNESNGAEADDEADHDDDLNNTCHKPKTTLSPPLLAQSRTLSVSDNEFDLDVISSGGEAMEADPMLNEKSADVFTRLQTVRESQLTKKLMNETIIYDSKMKVFSSSNNSYIDSACMLTKYHIYWLSAINYQTWLEFAARTRIHQLIPVENDNDKKIDQKIAEKMTENLDIIDDEKVNKDIRDTFIGKTKKQLKLKILLHETPIKSVSCLFTSLHAAYDHEPKETNCIVVKDFYDVDLLPERERHPFLGYILREIPWIDQQKVNNSLVITLQRYYAHSVLEEINRRKKEYLCTKKRDEQRLPIYEQLQTTHCGVACAELRHVFECKDRFCIVCLYFFCANTGIAVIGPQAIDPSLLPGNYANYPDEGCKTILEGLRSGLGENIVANCTQLNNVDYYQPGNPSTYAASPEECCSLCFFNSGCNYWTLYQNQCYFKETDDGKTNSNGRVSGQCTNKNSHSKVQNAYGCNDVACVDTSGFSAALSMISSMQKNNELSAIVVMLGLSQTQESEGHDRTSIELPGNQNALVTAIYQQNNGSVPIICVLIHGGTLALGSAANQCDAILDAWYPGQMGGYAIADVIFGYKNPAGRAAVTYYKSTSDLPPPGQMSEYYGKGVTYRYFTGVPLYPFGFGLSYTNFSYSNLRTNATDNQLNGCDVIKVTVAVKNTGSVAGDEVVQLYVIHMMSATVMVPRVRLADFERVKDLQPGASQDVDLILTPRYHAAVYNETSPTYFQPDVNIESGAFMIYVGGGQPGYYQDVVSQQLTVTTAQPLANCTNQD